MHVSVDPDVHKIKKKKPNLEKQVTRRMSNLILPEACVCVLASSGVLGSFEF